MAVDDESPAKTNEPTRATDDPASTKKMGKETAAFKTKELETEAEIEKAKIAAELRKAEIEADLKKAELAAKADIEKKKIEADDHDGERNDRTSLAKVLLSGAAVIVALSIAGVLGYNAMKTGSAFNFEGFGFSAGVGEKEAASASDVAPASSVVDTDSSVHGEDDSRR
jgi:hypothetical protein